MAFVRNYPVWTAAGLAEQILSPVHELDAASKNGLQFWVALAGVDNDLSRLALLTRIVQTLKTNTGLGAWKTDDLPWSEWSDAPVS